MFNRSVVVDAARDSSVVVTGGGSGIGFEIATALDNRGWMVTVLDTNSDAIADLARRSPTIEAIVGDVRSTDDLTRAADRAGQRGRLAAWVNNAAVVRTMPLHLVDDVELNLVLDVNLAAVIAGTRTALRSFLAEGVPGSIVNLSSIHAKFSFPGYALYDTCKAGVEALTRYVCVEYGHLGIRCNAVAPGAVLTPASLRFAEESGDPKRAISDTEKLAPMQRMSSPAEIANAVVFLLAKESFAINGHTLAVDNGMSSRSNTFPPDPTIKFGQRATP